MPITPPQSPIRDTHESESDDSSRDVARPAKSKTKTSSSSEVPIKDIQLVPVCFTCHGNSHGQSLGNRSSLERLILPVCENEACFPSTMEICSFTYDPTTALVLHMDKLFLLVKQMISTIQLSAEMFSSNNQGDNERQKIAAFFEYIIVFIQRQTPLPDVTHFVQQLAEQLHQVLLYSREPPKNDGIHLYLDVVWGITRVFHVMELTYPDVQVQRIMCRYDNNIAEASLFSQSCQLLIWDLLKVAADKFQQVYRVDRHKKSFCTCSCVGDIWTLVSGLVDYRHTHIAGQTFWNMMHDVIQRLTSSSVDAVDGSREQEQELDTTVFVITPAIPGLNDPLDFCYWLVDHLTQLLSVSGSSPGDASDGHAVLRLLLNLSLSSNNMDEMRLRQHISHLLTISSKWPPSSDILLILWENFYKKLNQNFAVAAFGVKGLQSVGVTVTAYLGECRKRCDSPFSGWEVDSSYGLFLRLTGSTLMRLFQLKTNYEWRHIKGRFYSKFHPRKMHDLTEVGLHNFTCLFLTLCLVADLSDVSTKLLDFYDMLPETKLDSGRRMVMWKGMFALTVIHDSRGIDVACITDRLSRSFDASCREYSQVSRSDPSNHQRCWDLILFYVSSIQELAESSQNLGILHKLIGGSGLPTLLPMCSLGHMTTILSTIDCILTKLRMAVTRDSQEMYKTDLKYLSDHLWRNIYPFIKTQARTLTPPRHLSDIASLFCLVSLKIQPPTTEGRSETFLSCFQYFTMKHDVSVMVSCRFLGNVLHIILPHLATQLPNHERELIRTWVRCYLLIQPSDADLQVVNRCLIRLPEVNGMLQQAALDQMPNNTIFTFIKALGIIYRQTEGLLNKLAFRDQASVFFSDLTKIAVSALRTTPAAEVVASMYGFLCRIIKHCSPIIYIKSKPNCELPQMLDCLFLPPSLFNSDKSPSPCLLAALRDNALHLLHGLSELSYMKDAYIARRLKDFITVLVTHFTLGNFLLKQREKGNAQISTHPLMVYFTRGPNPQITEYILQLLTDILTTGRFSPGHRSIEIQTLMAEIIALPSITLETREKYKLVLLGVGDPRKDSRPILGAS